MRIPNVARAFLFSIIATIVCASNCLKAFAFTTPIITSFVTPDTSDSLSITVSAFSVNENYYVSGYMLTESPTKPLASAPGWINRRVTNFTFSGPGTRSVYAWIKDTAGNVSNPIAPRTVVVTLPATVDTTPPTITHFILPPTSVGRMVGVSSFSATDNVGVTGYLLTESPTKPLASDPRWYFLYYISVPAFFEGGGTRTMYAWAKDAAGNVSEPFTPQTVDLPDGVEGENLALQFITAKPFETYLSVEEEHINEAKAVGCCGPYTRLYAIGNANKLYKVRFGPMSGPMFYPFTPNDAFENYAFVKGSDKLALNFEAVDDFGDVIYGGPGHDKDPYFIAIPAPPEPFFITGANYTNSDRYSRLSSMAELNAFQPIAPYTKYKDTGAYFLNTGPGGDNLLYIKSFRGRYVGLYLLDNTNTVTPVVDLPKEGQVVSGFTRIMGHAKVVDKNGVVLSDTTALNDFLAVGGAPTSNKFSLVSLAAFQIDNGGIFNGDSYTTFNAAPPYSAYLDTTKLSNGPHTLKFSFTDIAKNDKEFLPFSEAVNFTVNNPSTPEHPNGKIPMVVINSPVPGQVPYRNNQTNAVATVANLPKPEFSKIEFWVDGVFKANGSDTRYADIYTVTIDPTTMNDGAHTIMAKIFKGSDEDPIAVSQLATFYVKNDIRVVVTPIPTATPKNTRTRTPVPTATQIATNTPLVSATKTQVPLVPTSTPGAALTPIRAPLLTPTIGVVSTKKPGTLNPSPTPTNLTSLSLFVANAERTPISGVAFYSGDLPLEISHASGKVNLSEVSIGKTYKVIPQKSGYTFKPKFRKLKASADSVNFAHVFIGTAIDLPLSCLQIDATDKLLAVANAAYELKSYGISLTGLLKSKAKSSTKDKINAAFAKLLVSSQALPEMTLSCIQTSSCSLVSLSTHLDKYRKSIEELHKLTLSTASAATKSKDASSSSVYNSRINTLRKRLVTALGRFPRTNYVCKS